MQEEFETILEDMSAVQLNNCLPTVKTRRPFFQQEVPTAIQAALDRH